MLSRPLQRHGCVLSIQSLHPLHFSFAVQFQQDYYCSLFYQVWQTFSSRVARDVGMLSDGATKTDWTDVSDTLCDASPTDPLCIKCCERLSLDFLLLLICQEEKKTDISFNIHYRLFILKVPRFLVNQNVNVPKKKKKLGEEIILRCLLLNWCKFILNEITLIFNHVFDFQSHTFLYLDWDNIFSFYFLLQVARYLKRNIPNMMK